MKKYRACFLSIIILYCYIGLPIYSQNKDTLCIHGDFVCTIGKYLVYCQNSDDTEANERKLQRLDVRNYRSHSYCIDSTMTSNCLKISDSALIYAKGRNIILWHVPQNAKYIYWHSKQNLPIVNLAQSRNRDYLMVSRIDYEAKEMLLTIMGKKMNILFEKKIKLNGMEIEGAIPISYAIESCFVILVQDKLYLIDCERLKINLITNHCDVFTTSTHSIIYYKFISDDKTRGYELIPSRNEIQEIDRSIEQSLYDCPLTWLFTSRVNDENIPIYYVCGKAYRLEKHNWQEIPKIIIYQDKAISITVPIINGTFQYNWFSFSFLNDSDW